MVNRSRLSFVVPRFLVITALLPAPCAWSQTTMGVVSGTVRDQSQAVVPKAALVLTNIATNNSQSATSNEVGFYIFPSVVPGSYRLTAQSPGMQKFEGTFTVRVTDRVVIDPELQPGLTATTVEVKELTPLLAVDHPTASTTLERERISQLPVNGRSLNTLLGNLPGYEGARLNGMFNDATEWVLEFNRPQ